MDYLNRLVFYCTCLFKKVEKQISVPPFIFNLSLFIYSGFLVDNMFWSVCFFLFKIFSDNLRL